MKSPTNFSQDWSEMVLFYDNIADGVFLQGKYTFEDGRMYEGEFVKDCMADFPAFTPGMSTPSTPYPDDSKEVLFLSIYFSNIISFLNHQSLYFCLRWLTQETSTVQH